MTTMSLSIEGATATFTNDRGHTFTASEIAVEPGDQVSVDLAGSPYLVIRRDEIEIGRYPMRDEHGWHFEDMRTIEVWQNPFLPEETS